MARFLAGRFVQSLAALIVLVVGIFVAIRLTGNPAALLLPINATPEQREEFARQNGFDQPIPVQLVKFFGDILRGDLGTSLRQDRPALQIVLEAFPTTLSLAGISLLTALVLALAVGTAAARRPGGIADRATSLFGAIAASIPDFWIAIMGILVFAVALHWLPTSGHTMTIGWILPVITVAARPFGILVQIARGAVSDELIRPYVTTARSMGIGPQRILYIYVLKNSSVPILTVLGDQAAAIINGAVIAEVIFGFPGVGRLMIEAVSQRDFAVVQATVLVTGTAVVLLNFLLDLAYLRLDPRVQLSGAARR